MPEEKIAKYASDTSGVKAFSIQGRLYRERERLSGMTDEERAWRAKWVKDQHLSKFEPVHVPALDNAFLNPIRRFYRFPLDQAQKALVPVIGSEHAFIVRYLTGKALMGIVLLYAGAYYFKYNANDWTRKGGWRVLTNRSAVVPGDPGYPALSDRNSPSDYAARGFKDCPI